MLELCIVSCLEQTSKTELVEEVADQHGIWGQGLAWWGLRASNSSGASGPCLSQIDFST